MRFTQRNSESLENYKYKLKEVNEELENKIKINDQKTIDKFEKWVFLMK